MKSVLLGLVLFAGAVGPAWAEQSVIVNGERVTCQNECTVNVSPGGGTTVTDSQGGWVRNDGPWSPQDPPLDP